MTSVRRTRLTSLVLLASLLLSTCQTGPSQADLLTIFAASSLSDAMDGLIMQFEQQHPSVTVRRSYASSAQLALQLSLGAQADLFASADNEQMDYVRQHLPLVGNPTIFASNQITLLVPPENPAAIVDILDLRQPGIRLILAVPGTPLRQYSDQVLEKLSADAPQGEQLRQQILANVVSEEDNARQVVAKIYLGEADAGFVYRSDAFSSLGKDSLQIDIPEALNVQASYPIGILAAGSSRQWAHRFVEFTLTPEGQAILQQWGFGAVP